MAVYSPEREALNMIRTIEAVIDASGNVQLLEPIQLKGVRRALVTILEEPPSVATDLSTLGVETVEQASSEEEENSELSMAALSGAYADDEPEYPLHVIKEWNPEYAGG
jgi:hypothetical protein